MRNRIILVYFFLSLFAGCIDDEGNYNYKKLNEPVFKEEPIMVFGYEGEMVNAASDFYFEKDSTERLAEVCYEWTLNGDVISEERGLFISTDTLIKRAGITKFSDDPLFGYFIVIDKSTGIRYMNRVSYFITPKYYGGDWLVISENGNDTKLSFVKRRTRNVNGQSTFYYEVRDNLYKTLNGEDIPGKPRRIRYNLARNISQASGSATIITDKAVYELNNENMLKAHDVKDQFEGGIPADFSAVDVFHMERVSYLAMEDGRLYRREMLQSWLGGKYVNEPYSTDNKGYKITRFGVGGFSRWECLITPCYDELNRRVMMVNAGYPYAIKPVTKGPYQPVLPVWGMDEGTEVLYIAEMKNIDLMPYTFPYSLFTIVYNQGGKTYLSDFVVNRNTIECLDSDKLEWFLPVGMIIKPMPFPGGNLDKDSRFITTLLVQMGTAGMVIFYTKDNELRYINKSTRSDNPLLKFDAKITMLRLTTYNVNNGQVAIGLENGEFMMVDISSLNAPYVYEESRANLGGRVVDAMELRNETSGFDNY
ncbi:PKD-like family lipoprotein [uncultured Butyricimonas sp.]|uniref:PKD-like family lipoprotein n=1 Tax=uncultured Butyricimonas sp. TaxID=1268785 RepID=UPI0026DB7F0F|nr:PKD-like family lipoprotein [uncultured Butyricimonas sp.]